MTLNLENPFSRTVLFRADVASPGSYALRSDTYAYNRAVRLNFSTTSSALPAPAWPRKSIRNDDQKKGENGGS